MQHEQMPPSTDRVQPVGFAAMDAIHSEFDELLVRASEAGFTDYLELLIEIDAHLRRHFSAEDRWMVETFFPPRQCHIDEHAAVLLSSEEVLALARRGNSEAAPRFIEALRQWLPGHADHLDSALAAWLCKTRFGGKPVIVHRRLATREN